MRRPFRVWAVDVGGLSITMIGGASEVDRFEDFIPVVERLLDSMSFKAP